MVLPLWGLESGFGFSRLVPIEEIRAKEGNLSIPLFVGGETQAQTDAAPRVRPRRFRRRLQSGFRAAKWPENPLLPWEYELVYPKPSFLLPSKNNGFQC